MPINFSKQLIVDVWPDAGLFNGFNLVLDQPIGVDLFDIPKTDSSHSWIDGMSSNDTLFQYEILTILKYFAKEPLHPCLQ